MLNGFRVDFWIPQLKLVIETDGLTYHRNAHQQTKRARSQQAHTAAGLTALFFTRYQVVFEPDYVETILRRVVARL
jgi:very-short-patch-repair endonuclease